MCCYLLDAHFIRVLVARAWFKGYPLLIILVRMIPHRRAALALVLVWGLMGGVSGESKLIALSLRVILQARPRALATGSIDDKVFDSPRIAAVWAPNLRAVKLNGP
jgi:hypothetical protein